MFNFLPLGFELRVDHLCKGNEKESACKRKKFTYENLFTKYGVEHIYSTIIINNTYFFTNLQKTFILLTAVFS